LRVQPETLPTGIPAARGYLSPRVARQNPSELYAPAISSSRDN
jgi:hypothetical protein